jgi:hypothetical protein
VNRDEILKKPLIEIRVLRSGMFQRIPFKIIREKTPIGDVPYLTSDRIIDMNELLRIAEEYNLPVRAKNGTVFPKGKMAKDFIGL